MVGPVVDHADQKEHAGRADAVGDHLEHRPVHAPRPVLRPAPRPDRDAEDDVAHVADRAVGDQLLEVGLGHGGKGAVDDVDHAEDAQDTRRACSAAHGQIG